MSESDSMPSGASFLWESSAGRTINAPERFTEEQRAIARAARKFAATEIFPRIAQIESKKSGLVPELLRNRCQFPREPGDAYARRLTTKPAAMWVGE